MALTPKERAELFETAAISEQLRKYIAAKQEVGIDSIIEVFYDQDPMKIKAFLNKLTREGLLAKDSGIYKTNGVELVLSNDTETAWKAAQLLKTFTSKDLERVTGIRKVTIRDFLRRWTKSRAIIKVGYDKKFIIYQILKKSNARPMGLYIRNKQ